jgi:hypothetical protein
MVGLMQCRDVGKFHPKPSSIQATVLTLVPGLSADPGFDNLDRKSSFWIVTLSET